MKALVNTRHVTGVFVEVPVDDAIVQVDAVAIAVTRSRRRPGDGQRPDCGSKRTSDGIIQA